MAWDITVEFPLWGEDGEFPQDGFFYESGDQVNEKHLDALWNGTQTLQDETESALEDIDSDRDGVVDEADTTNLYKNNDIDSDGDGKVDAADDADTVGGEPPSNFADTNHGNEEHSADFTTLTEVNNNADVPNADFADSAGNADTVDGLDASAFQPPTFGDGGDGSITDPSSLSGVYNATNVDIGGNTTVPDYLILKATESVTISGTLDATGSGASGGAGGGTLNSGENGTQAAISPHGSGGSGGGGNGSPGGDGGDGDLNYDSGYIANGEAVGMGDRTVFLTELAGAGGGGGGGEGTHNSGPSGGCNVNDVESGSFPSGGGGSAAIDGTPNDVGGNGGDGGGVIIIIAPEITITGNIIADGEDGGDGGGSSCGAGGGGGGCGGFIGLYSRAISGEQNIYSRGGAGGLGGNNGGDGADGAGGYIVINTKSIQTPN